MKRFGIISLLLLLSAGVSAAEVVGQVILSFGQNYAVNGMGEKRALKRKSEVFANDLLVTSSKGRLQVKFSDDSRLSLKPKTEFRIAEYRFDEANPDEGKAIYKLLKGGMRTISGKIGKENPDNYSMETVVATIGIRGTHYGTEYTQQGLYTETVEGTVAVKTEQGTVLVNAGEAVSINAQNGSMRKGKATGQTAQGTAEEKGEEEQDSDSSDGTSKEGSEEANDGAEPEETASEEGSSEKTQTENSDDIASEESSDQDSASSDDTIDTGTETTLSSDDSSSGTENSGEANSVTMDTSVSTTGNSTTTTDTTATATDPGLTASQPTTSAPNPTGNGSEAPNGSFSLVAFIDNDAAKGKRDNSGIVQVDGSSSMTIDNTSGQDRITGIRYVDSGSSSTDPCNPCTMTGPSDQTLVRDAGTETLSDGTKISWGRWNQGAYTLEENGTQQDTLSDFHYLYAGSTTPESVIKAKTGSYIYKFSIGNPITIPQFEDGKTGELVAYDSTPPRTGRLAGGTYMKVDWGQQKVVEMNIHLQSKVHGGVDDYILTEEIVGGAYQDVMLSDVLNGGEMKLQGTCSGSGRCINTVNLDGRMNMELVGSDAEAAAISYGASGSTTGSSTTNDISVVGTTVLK
ncbi:MAG: FecR domain-containing protein [Neptuniibacter sp.]